MAMAWTIMAGVLDQSPLRVGGPRWWLAQHRPVVGAGRRRPLNLIGTTRARQGARVAICKDVCPREETAAALGGKVIRSTLETLLGDNKRWKTASLDFVVAGCHGTVASLDLHCRRTSLEMQCNGDVVVVDERCGRTGGSARRRKACDTELPSIGLTTLTSVRVFQPRCLSFTLLPASSRAGKQRSRTNTRPICLPFLTLHTFLQGRRDPRLPASQVSAPRNTGRTTHAGPRWRQILSLEEGGCCSGPMISMPLLSQLGGNCNLDEILLSHEIKWYSELKGAEWRLLCEYSAAATLRLFPTQAVPGHRFAIEDSPREVALLFNMKKHRPQFTLPASLVSQPSSFV